MKINDPRFWNLLIEMTKKEFRARYKNTYFGFLWIFVNPLLQMLVIGFIFRLFIKEPIDNYYLFLLVGLLIWNFFNLSLNKATPSIVNERSLIKKAKFPREVIPLSIIFSNFIHLLAAFVLVLIPVLYLGLGSIADFWVLPFGFILLLLFTIGISLFTSAMNVRFRDVSFFTQAILILWFYATPIIYSISIIPDELIWLWIFNPLTLIIQLTRNALLSEMYTRPWISMGNIFIIFVILVLGVIVFRKESKDFDDWV